MKKKIFSLIALLTMIFSLTGCIKYNATMEIKSDKSMDFTIIYGFSKSMLEMSNQNDNGENQTGDDGTISSQEVMDEEELQKLKDAGFEVKEYSDESYKGYEISKKIANIDDYSSDTDIEYSLSGIFDEKADSKIFKVEKGTDKNVYTANFKFDANEANEDNQTSNENDTTTNDTTTENDGDNMDLSQLTQAMSSSMDLKYVVKLPSPALSSNATSKNEDGTELTWNLSLNNEESITFKFELNNAKLITPTPNVNSTSGTFSFNNPVLLGGIGVFALIVIVLIVVFVKGQKKDSGGVSTVSQEQAVAPTTTPVQPVTPVAQTTPVEPVVSVTQTPAPVEPVASVTPAPTQVQPAAPVTPAPAPVEPVASVTPAPAQVQPAAPAVEPIEITPSQVTPTEPVTPTTNTETK